MDELPYIFDSPIVPHAVGTYTYTVVFLPEEMTAELPFEQYPRLRIHGIVGNMPFSGACQPVRGRWYLLLSKRMMKAGGFEVGDWVTVRFQIADQTAVDIPEALRLALERDPHIKAVWEKLSAGKRRGLAYRVASAKTAPTQARRVSEVLENLAFGDV